MQNARKLVAVRRDIHKRITHLVVLRSDGIREVLSAEESLKADFAFYVSRGGEALLVDVKRIAGQLIVSSPLQGPIDLPEER